MENSVVSVDLIISIDSVFSGDSVICSFLNVCAIVVTLILLSASAFVLLHPGLY